MATFRSYIQLLKLRIGFTIALTAVIGYMAVATHVTVSSVALLALAMLLGSASSSIFNHFYDQDIDRLMHRTSNRPFASGAVAHPVTILALAAALLIGGMTLATLTFNWVVAAHLALGAFVYGVVYTVWLKRRTWLNIVIGGAAGSFAVLAGAAAVDPSIWLLPWLLALTLFLWTPSHFWALAIMLKEDYQRANVPMLPCVVGDARTARYILINSILLVGSTLLPWAFGELGHVYGAVVTLVGAWFLWGNVKLVRDPSLAVARKNFFASMQYLLGVFVAVLLDKHLSLPSF